VFSKLINENTTYNVKLLIAGEGPKRERLEELCNLLGLSSKAIFLGAVPEKFKSVFIKHLISLFIRQ